MLFLFLLILGIIAFFAEVLLILAWIAVRFTYNEEKNFSYFPPATVIIPCKYVTKRFKENIKSICNQDYKNYNIIFVTDSKNDSAFLELKKLVGNKKNIKILISDYIEGCSGKISALIKGVKSSKNTEVYVFADSDITPHKNWLKNLVGNLKEKDIGATTGYRWYLADDKKSLILSNINMLSCISLFFDISNFTWGGSTAIKKETFEKFNVLKKWKQGFSDDLILTNVLRKNKKKIKIVPKCIVESPSEGNLKEIINWGIKQFTWIKWYYPSAWFLSVIGMVGLKIATILGFIVFFMGYTIPGTLMISTIFLEMIVGGVGHITMKKIMPNSEKRYGKTFYYAISAPVVFFVLGFTNLITIFQKEIKWGGRTYTKTRRVINLKKLITYNK